MPDESIQLKKTNGILHSALCVVLFFCALVGTALLIGRKLPLPEIDTVTDKMNWLGKYGDRYDTLFLGSSRMNKHIHPDMFDQLMAEAGDPTHSFNLGINAMRPAEDTFVLETILAKRKTPLKYVFVESNPLRLDSFDDPDANTKRKIYWLDGKRFLTMMRRLQALGADEFPEKGGKWVMMSYNIRQFANRQLNLGRGLEWADAQFAPPAKSLKRLYGANWQGWETIKQRPIKSSEWKILQNRLEDLKKSPSVAFYGTWDDQEQLREKRRLIEAHGGRMIIYTPPLAYRQRFTPDPQTLGDVPVLSFWNPEAYPELYEQQNLQDSNHLNSAGAEIFTRIFVQQFLKTRGK